MSQAEQIPLSCDEFEDRVNELLDLRLSPRKDPTVQRHAEGCPTCREIMQAYVTVDDSMKLLKADIDSILSDSQNRTSHRRVQISRVTAIVASAALIVLLGLGWGQLTETDIPSGPTVAQIDRLLPAAPVQASEQPDSAVSAARPQFPEEAWLLANSLQSDELLSLADRLAPIFRYSSGLPGVRPMRGTMNIAIEYLLRTFEDRQRAIDPDLGQSFHPRVMLAAV